MLKTTIKGSRELLKRLDSLDKKSRKALEIAVRVEGFRQLRKLREEIKSGTPGGREYEKKLSKIAARTKTGRLRKNQMPLYRLARLLRYNIEFKAGKFAMSFGFVTGQKSRLSSSWKRLLIKHQEGGESLYTGSRTELGRNLARIGGRLEKRGDPDAKYFFLRSTTGRRLSLPKRPIIQAFWASYQDDAERNIVKNFRRKLQGERI